MFCEKCGKELPEGSAFCEACGEQVPKQTMEIPKVLKENPFKKVPPKYLALGGIAIAFFIIIIAVLANRKTVINLNDYVTVDFSGYDSMGKAQVDLDEEAFLRDYNEKIKYKNVKYENEIFEPAEYIWNMCVSGSLNEREKLSNGQQIIYSWKCEDEEVLEKFGCKLKYEDITFTVEGLADVTTFDPFADIELVYSGVAPEGAADVKNNSKDKLYQSLLYTVEPSNGLSNGDEITVSVNTYYGDIEEYCMSNFGKTPETLEKKYKVDGLGSYVVSLKEVPEEILMKMKSQSEDVLKAHVANEWNEHEKLDGMTYMGSYLIVAKNLEEQDVKNALRLVYKISASDNYEEENIHQNFEYYYDTTFTNLMVMPDGSCSVDLSSYDTPEDNFTREVIYDNEYGDYDSYYYYGYETMESLINKRITAFIDSYTYETDIQ